MTYQIIFQVKTKSYFFFNRKEDFGEVGMTRVNFCSNYFSGKLSVLAPPWSFASRTPMEIVRSEVSCRHYETYLEKYRPYTRNFRPGSNFPSRQKVPTWSPSNLMQRRKKHDHIIYKSYICYYYVLVAMCSGCNVLSQLVVSYLFTN